MTLQAKAIAEKSFIVLALRASEVARQSKRGLEDAVDVE
jgi:hypothetical protein